MTTRRKFLALTGGALTATWLGGCRPRGRPAATAGSGLPDVLFVDSPRGLARLTGAGTRNLGASAVLSCDGGFLYAGNPDAAGEQSLVRLDPLTGTSIRSTPLGAGWLPRAISTDARACAPGRPAATGRPAARARTAPRGRMAAAGHLHRRPGVGTGPVGRYRAAGRARPALPAGDDRRRSETVRARRRGGTGRVHRRSIRAVRVGVAAGAGAREVPGAAARSGHRDTAPAVHPRQGAGAARRRGGDARHGPGGGALRRPADALHALHPSARSPAHPRPDRRHPRRRPRVRALPEPGGRLGVLPCPAAPVRRGTRGGARAGRRR